jgi:imidazolonepropionase-like amidohydrolase
MIPDEEYQNGHILTAQSCKKLADAGVRINLGAHGQIQGLGVHWELWMMEQGGMSNYQALKTATINGAELLGMSHQIGTLATGKLADLIVLDKNPLENIRNSESVTHTMINGRLYQTHEMREIYPVNKPRTKFFWELEGSGNAYPMLQHGESLMNIRCACGI